MKLALVLNNHRWSEALAPLAAFSAAAASSSPFMRRVRSRPHPIDLNLLLATSALRAISQGI